jgi:hypothetical protein
MQRGAFTVWLTRRTGVQWYWSTLTLLPESETRESCQTPQQKNGRPGNAEGTASGKTIDARPRRVGRRKRAARPSSIQRPPISPRVIQAARSGGSSQDAEVLAKARVEARVLFGLIGKGETVDSVRKLIGIDQSEERTLFASMKAHAEAGVCVKEALLHRVMVLEEFDRLAKRPEHAERIAAAEAKAAARAAPAMPIAPILPVRVVPPEA